MRHFLRFRDFERPEFDHLFARTRVIKERFKNYVAYQPLVDRMLAMVATITTLDVIEKDGLLAHAGRMGELLKSGLKAELAGLAGVKDVRGMGLMLGVELDRPCADIVKRALAAGLVSNVTADKVIRILPPLVIQEAEAKELVSILAGVVKGFLSEAPAAAAA